MDAGVRSSVSHGAGGCATIVLQLQPPALAGEFWGRLPCRFGSKDDMASSTAAVPQPNNPNRKGH